MRMRNLVFLMYGTVMEGHFREQVASTPWNGSLLVIRCSLGCRTRCRGWRWPQRPIVASIGNGAAIHKGREFAAWMGLVPKQHSTGGKAKLYGISKRGNCYLRKILVHGARAVVLRSKRDRIAMGAWLTALEMRAPRNVLNYRHGEQAGADRMGGSRNGTGLPICSEHTGSISGPTSSSPPRFAPDE